MSTTQTKFEVIAVMSSFARSGRASSVTNGAFLLCSTDELPSTDFHPYKIRSYHGVPLAVSFVKIKLISEFTETLSSFIMNTSTTDDNSLASRPEGRTIFSTFKVCKSVHHHTVQINQQTRCNSFSSLLLDIYVQLNMFRTSSRPSSGAQQLQ